MIHSLHQMFECSACIQRCIRTIFADVLITHPFRKTPHRLQSLRAPGSQYPSWNARRTYTIETSQHRQPSVETLPTDFIPSATNSLSHARQLEGEQGEEVADGRRAKEYKASHLKRELYWVQDPLKLANKVVDILKRDQEDDYNKAVALVRLASKDMACTVSWNHLVDYNMGKMRVKKAISVYNEMKKRAQTPDAHTYTTLFRGFSRNTKYPRALEKTLSIYHSMFADRSPVKPSVVHTNAVLNVCAFVGDIDAMFGVAARLPTKGRGAPDKLTFTTILNAIRVQAFEDTKGQDVSAAVLERQQRAIMQGRRMWEEIRDRWASGDLMMDEELVCAMGRLLLLGHTDQDNDDILSLLQQTMQIPRQVPRLGDPARTGALKHAAALDRLEQKGDLGEAELSVLLPPSNHKSEDAESEDIETTNPFAPLSRFLPNQYRVRPGVKTLSLALEACTAMHLSRPAQDYWGLLTSPEHYNIIPDRQNYHVYLRLLRLQRASKLAVEIVEEMMTGMLIAPTVKSNDDDAKTRGLQTKTIRIALSCCLRDKNNRHALEHAQRLVRIMTDTFETPDSRSLIYLIDVALGHKPREWRILMEVARSTRLHIRNLQSLLTYRLGASDKNMREKEKKENLEVDITELVRRCVGVYDIVVSLGREGMVGKERQKCMEERSILAAWLTRRSNVRSTYEKGEEERRTKTLKFDGEMDSAGKISWRKERDGPRMSLVQS